MEYTIEHTECDSKILTVSFCKIFGAKGDAEIDLNIAMLQIQQRD